MIEWCEEVYHRVLEQLFILLDGFPLETRHTRTDLRFSSVDEKYGLHNYVGLTFSFQIGADSG